MSQDANKMPALFVGHGSPMNALGGPYAEEWRAQGAALPRPRAILAVSAHWYVDETAVTGQSMPPTIHDFGGFPQALREMTYPAPGDSWLAQRTAELLAPIPVRSADDWGLDHGSWSVLAHLFPQADVPVVQLAIDRRQPARFHYELGQRLAPLRDEGVLILGSGDFVHNLPAMIRTGEAPAFDWAVSFNETVKGLIARGEHQPLVDWTGLGREAALSIPTAEHFLPLLYVLGAQQAGEPVSFFNDAIDLGSVSMTGFRVG